MKYLVAAGAAAIAISSTGCVVGDTSTARTGPGSNTTNLTAGVVQKEIRKGMTADEVAIALGSPNIVSTDATGLEVWIYDRISSRVTQSSSSAYGTLLLIGGARSTGSRETSQSTFTVVIKYDEMSRVRDFAYHTSRF